MNIKTAIAVVAIVAVATGIGYWAGQHRGESATTPGASTSTEKKVLYWYDPMSPAQHFDKPGKSPSMDMALVPKYADDETGAGLKVDPDAIQNLGMRVATVERGILDESISAVATVQFNDREVALLQSRTAGFVQKVYARATGDVVARGAPLAEVLVPEWAGAQEEFLAVLRTGDKPLCAAARQRLILMGMPDTLVEEVASTGKAQPLLTLTAPIAGVIQELGVRAGMTLAQGATVVKINGLGTVWLEAAVPEAQAAPLRVGQAATVTIGASHSNSLVGKVIAVLPQLDAANRTLRVRVELPNRGESLRPGMFAQVHFAAGPGNLALLVPSEAVIRTGTRDLVMVASGGGHYVPVAVRLGAEGGGKTVVRAGLNAGDQVVASGQFLLDSEASLRGISAQAAPELAQEIPASKPVGPRSALPKAASATAPMSTKAMDPAVAPVAPPAPAAPVDAKAAVLAIHHGVGTIKSINAKTIVISHGPIASIGWGAMTMPFPLATPDLAQDLQPGDTVEFGFVQDNGEAIVKTLRKVGGAS
jgi:Cu(I)/Ag(I) efflux system membrane fusion protein